MTKSINNEELIQELSLEQKIDRLLDSLKNVELLIQAHKLSLNSSLNRLYTPKEVAEMLDVHYHTVLEWIKLGKLEPWRDCKHKIRGWDVLEYIQGKERFAETVNEFGFLGLYMGSHPPGDCP